jgi:surface protein
MYGMFYNCSNLTSLDLSGFDTSSVTSMLGMFYSCSSLTSLDVSGFDTSSVTNMQQMFQICSSLTSLDVSGFDTSSVTNMFYMFASCTSLTSLDVTGFDTSSVTDMRNMFQACTNLTGLQISGWDVSSVTNGTNFLLGANNALSQAEYDAILTSWSLQPVQSGVTWHFGDAVYSADPIAVSIKMDGRMTGDTYTLTRWHEDADNYIVQEAGASDFDFEQSSVTVVDTVTGGSFTSGILVPYTIASRHGSTFINGAVDGTALTANTTPTSLPDLSATDLNLGYDYMGTIKEFAIWNVDLTDAGLEEATE